MVKGSPRDDMYRKLRAFEALAREQDDQIADLETEKEDLTNDLCMAARVIARNPDALQDLKQAEDLDANEDTSLAEVLRDLGVAIG